jgi:phosphoglucosamine mutase
MTQYFGTDGIRGKVGQHPITADFFLHLGWAVGSVLAKKGKVSVVIGKDTRASGYLFESALEAGFLSAGVNVELLGPMPTPAVAYLTQSYSADAGVVISASHNSHEDNGIKFFNAQGYKFSKIEQQHIEKKLSQPIQSVSSEKIGKAQRREQALGRYIEFCKSSFDKSLRLTGMRIIIDCAHGATYHIAEHIFSELGAEVLIINNKPDGFNINQNCGATDTQHLQTIVLEQQADLGIAFDGDGDRLMMVDKNGELVDGDELVFIIAKAWQSDNRLNNSLVVGTKMSNLGMRLALEELGIVFIESEVGDRFVLEKMQQHGAVLGGEGSGHIICLNQSTSGDGIISALQVLAVLAKKNTSLHILKSEMHKYPQTLINVAIAQPLNAKQQSELKTAQTAIEETLGKTGRVLIRPSGTEPLLRIMVEGKNAEKTQKNAEKLAKIVRSFS